MGTIFRPWVTRPIPASAEITAKRSRRAGKSIETRVASWRGDGGKRSAEIVSTPAGDRIRDRSGVYVARYRDGDGIIRTVSTGCRDKVAAASVLAELERQADRVRSGCATTSERKAAAHAKTPLSTHVEDYVASLRRTQRSEAHVSERTRCLDRVVRETGWTRLADIDREALERWLHALRTLPAANASRSDWRPSARTLNAYAAAAVGFCRWAVRTNRLATNPLAGLAKANEAADRRRCRRPLTDREMLDLVRVATLRPLAEQARTPQAVERAGDERRRSNWIRTPITKDNIGELAETARRTLSETSDGREKAEQLAELGRERALAIKVFLFTGLRLGELRSLRIGSVHLGESPYLSLDAANEKARRGAEQPLRQDLAEEIEAWLADRLLRRRAIAQATGGAIPASLPADEPLFSRIPKGFRVVLDRELRAAGIPKRDEQGRTIDVHGLRHSFASSLARGGVPVRVAMELLRHSDPRLTARTYQSLGLVDTVGALDALPSLSLGGDGKRRAAAGDGS